MRKSILLFVMAFLMYGMQTTMAQITSLYSFSESTTTYAHLTGATLSTASGDDGEQTSVPIGFAFAYDLQNYTTLTIGVNGALSFTLTDISYTNQLSNTSKKPIIAPLWDDLYARTGDSVKILYKTDGVAPNRTFTVEWKNISWRNAGDTVNFQVVLEETTNKIIFKYGPNYSTQTGRSASIGINDHTGGNNHFLSVVPGSTATVSSTVSTDTLSIASYPGNGKVYTFTYTPPSCLPPSTPTTTNITTVSAVLGWTEMGSATQWDVEYGPAGFTQGTGTLTNVTANPTTILNLSPATTYDWYVRARCSSSDSSTWLTGNSFTTACATITTLPWTEGFESMTSTGSGVIPNCWAEIGDWATASSSQSYNRAAHTGSKYIYTKYSADDWLMSPEFSLSAGVSYDFSFYYVTDGNSGWTTLETKMSNYQNKDSMNISIGTAVSGPNNTTYQKYTATFTPSTTGLYYFGIHVVATSSPWYITFDDFKLEVTPSCTQPTTQLTTNIQTTSAILNWTEAGTATTWDIEYGPSGFTQGTGTLLTGVTNKPDTLTGLTPSTTYDWYVRASCGAGSTSPWEGPSSFTTLCLANTAYPYTEGFENSVAPQCWSVINVSGTSANWAQYTGTKHPSNNAAYEGSKVAYFNAFSASSGQESILETKTFNTASLTNPAFSFYMFHDGGYTSSNDYLLVKVNDGSGWTLVDSLKRNNGSTGWVNYQYNLNSYDSLVKIAFDAVSGYGNDIHIDAFYLGEEVSMVLAPDTAICAGSTITIGETNDTNFSYNWYIAGSSTVIDTTSFITVDSAAIYVLVKNSTFTSATDTIIVSINQPAAGSFSGLASNYCSSDTAVTLTGTSASGVFAGSGVSANTFNPSLAMPGQIVISYSFTDTNGCSAIAYDTTNVGITPMITTSVDTAVCLGDSIKIGAYETSAGGVFFSEYIEGSSNNKALEIYNGTGQSINLDDYSIMTNYNGNPWSGQYHFPTGSTLAAGDVFVLANQNADTSILQVADDTLAYNAGGYVVGFNGDDVRALFYHSSATDSVMIDIIGANDLSDPGSGWDVAGVSSATKDHSLIRKSAVIHGDTNWANIAGTDSLSSAFLVYPKNTFSNLGSHTSTPLPTPSYSWSNGAITNETFVLPTAITTYTVNVSNGNCQVMDSVIVDVHALPTVNITAPDTFCNTSSALFDAGTGFTSYLWSTNAYTQTVTLDSNDLNLGNNTIWVKVGDANGCFASDTVTIFMTNCLGINSSENPIAIKIYPNPNNGRFTILFEGVQGKTIVEIIDINGRTVKHTELNISGTTHQKYNLTDITPGFYQIRVTNNNSTRITKIIVK